MATATTTRTWTIRPDKKSKEMMRRAIEAAAGRGGDKRGWRSRIINQALRMQLPEILKRTRAEAKA